MKCVLFVCEFRLSSEDGWRQRWLGSQRLLFAPTGDDKQSSQFEAEAEVRHMDRGTKGQADIVLSTNTQLCFGLNHCRIRP